MKEKPFISIVAYLHNNEKDIPDFLQSIDSLMKKNFETYELILVNDSSSDKTLDMCREWSKKISCGVSIINLTREHGIEVGMLAGSDKSIGDYIFEIDSTIIDYPIELLLEVYRKCVSGYDIVAAVPDIKVGIGSRMFYSIVNKFSYFNLSLTPESFRILSRRALNAVLNISEKTRYRKGIHSYIGFPKTKIKYKKISSRTSIPKRTLSTKISLGLDIIVSFTNLGLIVNLFLSAILFLFSLIIGAYVVYDYFFFGNKYVSGWASTMAFLSIAFSGMFFILAILSNYTSKILIETQGRPLYNISSIETYNFSENNDDAKNN